MGKNLLIRPKLKPLLKWVGGKTKLLNKLEPYFNGKFKTYIEPFLGGGAVFLRYYSIADDWIISDLNRDLIHFYKIVRDNPAALMKHLDRRVYRNVKSTYYRLRKRFNDKKKLNEYDIEFAALFLYLNKHGYNGMYRVNSNGEFNIPFGKYKNPAMFEKNNILGWSALLKQGMITCSDYRGILALAKDGDFIYLDPPYDGTFNNYNEVDFDQKKLRDACDVLKVENVVLLQSNSKTDNIRNLYDNYEIIDLESWDSLGQNKSSRAKRNEVLIR